MSNAAKLKKKAAEFEQKKQFDKALQLYIQILDESDGEDEEADVALYNRVGDLLMRQGSVGDAVNYYEKAVDLYAESGFFNNAIALCNKILRQSPGRNSIYYKLGKISAKKGFISDAKQNFLEYADRMQKGGQLDEAFRALKEFADLCPDQDDIRLMLADQLSKKDRKGEAIEQLQHLYEKFVAEGRGAEARATVDRMKAIDPNVEPKEGGGNRNQKSGDLVFLDLSGDAPPPPSKAPARPTARMAAAQARPTVPVKPPPEPEIDELPAEEPAEDALSSDDLITADSATDDLVADDDLLPLPPLDDVDVLEPLDVGEEPAPEVSGLMTLNEFSTDGADDSSTVSGFEQTMLDNELEGEFAQAGMPDLDRPLPTAEFDELELPEAIEEPAPERPHTHDLALPGRLPSLDVPHGRSPLSLTGEMDLIIPETDMPPVPRRPAVAPKRTSGPARPPANGRGSLDLEFTPEVDTGDMSGRTTGGTGALSLIGGAESLQVPEAEEAEVEPAEPVEAEAAEFEEAPAETGELELPSWMDGGEAEAEPPAGELPMLDVGSDEPAGHDELDDALLVLDDPVPKSRAEPPSRPHRHSHTPLAMSVDGLRQRATAEPTNWTVRRTLAEALLEDGYREEGLQEMEVVMLGLERSHDLEGARSVADEIIRLNPNSVRHHQKRVEYAFRAADKPRLADAYLELADSLFRAGHADKARAVYQRVLELAPDDARAQAALSTFAPAPREPRPAKAPGTPTTIRRQPAPAAATDDYVNLGDWLKEDEAPKSTRMVVDEEAPSGDEEADFADMLRKFKQGVAENVEEGDYESHYDLGVAYKEMGLVDEAIAEFQKALRGATGRVRTYEALGQCFLEKQQFRVAASILSRALNEPNVADDQLVGVLYLLGYACEALREPADAVTYYHRVFAVDIQFRDVADRLATLERVPR